MNAKPIFLVVGLTLLTSCSPRQGRIISRVIEAPSLSSNLFGISDRQRMAIYLPPSYPRGSHRFPVLYWLPNFNTPLWRYTGGSYQGFHLDQAMDRQIRKGTVREMIVVIPDATHFLGSSFYQNNPLSGNWEDYMLKDVVPYVDRHFRTIPQPASRGVTGHGVGGTGALKLALNHPAVFGTVYALSPALFDENGMRDLGILEENRLRRWQQDIESWKHLEQSKGRQKLQHYMQSCLNSASPEQFFDGFILAYGAAMAPDPQLPFPHIALPDRGGEGALDAELRDRYEQGFGTWRNRILHYQSKGLALRGITQRFRMSF